MGKPKEGGGSEGLKNTFPKQPNPECKGADGRGRVPTPLRVVSKTEPGARDGRTRKTSVLVSMT